MPNDDDLRDRYPNYFVVDIATLREVDEDFRNVERDYNKTAGVDLTLVDSQGWNRLPDSEHTLALWARLMVAAE